MAAPKPEEAPVTRTTRGWLMRAGIAVRRGCVNLERGSRTLDVMAAPVSSVLRRGDGLVVRTHRRTGTFTEPTSWSDASCAAALRYEAVDVPLARFGGEVWPGKRALAAAHARLAHVADVDARVLADVLLLA